MSDTPLVTIGILNYNGISFLKEIIPPILSLSYSNIEVIIFDNGSSDGSLEFIEGLENIQLFKSSVNLGYGAGKNELIRKSKGEYVLLIDNDILLCKNNTIEELLEYNKKLPAVSFISIPLIDRGAHQTEHYGLFYSSLKKKQSVEEIGRLEPFMAGGFIGGFVFFRKEVFEKIGNYDTIYPFNIDDYDLSARSWIMGYKIYIIPTLYAEHIGSINRSRVNNWCWKNNYSLSGFNRMILKNYQLRNLFPWLTISSIYILFKTLKKSIEFRSIKPMISYAKSIYLFIKDLPDTIRQRNIIQSKRVIDYDIFLQIKFSKGL